MASKRSSKKSPKRQKKGPSPEKAKKILEDGEVYGQPITEDQRKFFASIAYGDSGEDSGEKAYGGRKKYEEGGYYAVKADETDGDEPKYPINSADDVKDAWKLRNHAEGLKISKETLKNRIKRKAREYDVELSDDNDKEEKQGGGSLEDNEDNEDNPLNVRKRTSTGRLARILKGKTEGSIKDVPAENLASALKYQERFTDWASELEEKYTSLGSLEEYRDEGEYPEFYYTREKQSPSDQSRIGFKKARSANALRNVALLEKELKRRGYDLSQWSGKGLPPYKEEIERRKKPGYLDSYDEDLIYRDKDPEMVGNLDENEDKEEKQGGGSLTTDPQYLQYLGYAYGGRKEYQGGGPTPQQITGAAGALGSLAGAIGGNTSSRKKRESDDPTQEEMRTQKSANNAIGTGLSLINPALGAAYGAASGIGRKIAPQGDMTSDKDEDAGETAKRAAATTLNPVGTFTQNMQEHGAGEGLARGAVQTATLGLVNSNDIFNEGPSAFRDGGRLSMTEYQTGGRHEDGKDGGVDLGQDAEVEEGETRVGDYIFSDRLKLTKTLAKKVGLPEDLAGQTFADASKEIRDKYKKIRDNESDPYQNNAIEREYERLQKANDMKREKKQGDKGQEEDVEASTPQDMAQRERQSRQGQQGPQNEQQARQQLQALLQGATPGQGQGRRQNPSQRPQQGLPQAARGMYLNGGEDDEREIPNIPTSSTTTTSRPMTEEEQAANTQREPYEPVSPERQRQIFEQRQAQGNTVDEQGTTTGTTDNGFWYDQLGDSAFTGADAVKAGASAADALNYLTNRAPEPLPPDRYAVDSEVDYRPIDRDAAREKLERSYRRGEEAMRQAAQTPGQFLANRTQLSSDEALDRALTELQMDVKEDQRRLQVEQQQDQIAQRNAQMRAKADRLNTQAASQYRTQQDQALSSLYTDLGRIATQGERREMTEDMSDAQRQQARLRWLMMNSGQGQQQNEGGS